MNPVNNTSSNQNYLDLVQQATRRNTFSQLVDAATNPSTQPVDSQELVDQVQLSNQQLRDNARETGVELYALNMQRSAFQTYANATENANDAYNTNNSSDNSSNTTNNANVYQMNAEQVNSTLQTAQRRQLVSALYASESERALQPENVNPLGLVSNYYV